MLTYRLDISSQSQWLRSTPGEFALKQPYYCTEAGVFYAGRNFNTIRDYKDSWILFYTLDGCGLIEQNDVSVKLTGGQALFLNCREPQAYCTDPETGYWNHYWIHIDGSGIKGLEDLLIPEKKIIAMRANETELRKEFDSVLRNLENTSANTILSISLSIHRILTELITGNSISYSKNQALILKTADYISSHYNEAIELETLLKMAHMSKSYYMRLFRQYIGTTPYNYMLSVRMNRAREYLEVTDMSVHEIAMETGFSDDAAFSTRFSAMIGISPLRYRKSAITRHQAG